jgi:hypothetical protein
MFFSRHTTNNLGEGEFRCIRFDSDFNEIVSGEKSYGSTSLFIKPNIKINVSLPTTIILTLSERKQFVKDLNHFLNSFLDFPKRIRTKVYFARG